MFRDELVEFRIGFADLSCELVEFRNDPAFAVRSRPAMTKSIPQPFEYRFVVSLRVWALMADEIDKVGGVVQAHLRPAEEIQETRRPGATTVVGELILVGGEVMSFGGAVVRVLPARPRGPS